MINYKDIEQGTEEWFILKYRKIGGTLASGLFVNSDTLFLDLLSQELEDFEYNADSFTSEAMERGCELEPFARNYLSEYLDIEFKETGWLQSLENRLLGISPDGITEDETIQCEIKCFGRKKHTEVLYKNEIPKEYIHQCIHAFTVNPKLEKLYFIAFRPECEKNSFIKEVNLMSKFDIGLKTKIEIEQFGVKGQKIKSKFITEPSLVTVKEIVEISKNKANELLKKIEIEKEKLVF